MCATICKCLHLYLTFYKFYLNMCMHTQSYMHKFKNDPTCLSCKSTTIYWNHQKSTQHSYFIELRIGLSQECDYKTLCSSMFILMSWLVTYLSTSDKTSTEYQACRLHITNIHGNNEQVKCLLFEKQDDNLHRSYLWTLSSSLPGSSSSTSNLHTHI